MNSKESVPPEMQEAYRLVEEAVRRISEHVDAVQILVNKKRENGNDGTWHLSLGAGNWFARYGHALSWLEEKKAAHYRNDPESE